MTLIDPTKLHDALCPETFNSSPSNSCIGDICAAWRWFPLQANDPQFVAAVHNRISKHGEPHAKAVKFVMENREELGLPTKPTHGYCGLAGKPEITI